VGQILQIDSTVTIGVGVACTTPSDMVRTPCNLANSRKDAMDYDRLAEPGGRLTPDRRHRAGHTCPTASAIATASGSPYRDRCRDRLSPSVSLGSWGYRSNAGR